MILDFKKNVLNEHFVLLKVVKNQQSGKQCLLQSMPLL